MPTPDRFYLTPRYVYNRIRDLVYQRAHPADPWLTPEAIGLLGTLLHPTDRGAEFGSGRSTLWFAGRVAALTSVETNARWHESVTLQLKERGESKAPGTRPAELGPATSTWAEIGQALASWRTIWTSNGVWDTAIFFRPTD
ncbi:MAG TPA: hypothetical protein VN714_28940 [Trebonia sp.]|nr:hypothetical protein [Trebonia sp.]